MKEGRLSAPAPARLTIQEIFLVIISVRGCGDLRATMQLEGLCELKILITLSGIKPVTFRL